MFYTLLEDDLHVQPRGELVENTGLPHFQLVWNPHSVLLIHGCQRPRGHPAMRDFHVCEEDYACPQTKSRHCWELWNWEAQQIASSIWIGYPSRIYLDLKPLGVEKRNFEEFVGRDFYKKNWAGV